MSAPLKPEAVLEATNSAKRPRADENAPPGPNKRPRSGPLPGAAVASTELEKKPATAPAAPTSATTAAAPASSPKASAPASSPKPLVPASPSAKKSDSARAPKGPEDVEGVCDLATLRAFEFERVEEFGPLMLKRYESYRRSDFRPPKMKKICNAINPALAKVSEHYIIALKGLAKVFVGDVVETALEVRKQLGDTGALKPNHLREAFRRLRRDGAIPGTKEANFL